MFKNFRYTTAVGLMAALAAFWFTSSATAQNRARGGIRPGSVSPARLLTSEAVQSDLKLSKEQIAKASEINEALTKGRHDLFASVAKESKERAKKVAELEQQIDVRIKELLDDSQEKRFNELLLQANGASELLKKPIQETLGITEEQQTRLKNVNRENADARRTALANFDGDRMAKMVELQQEADKKLLSVLTDDQRKRFEAMQGKKIDIGLFKT